MPASDPPVAVEACCPHPKTHHRRTLARGAYGECCNVTDGRACPCPNFRAATPPASDPEPVSVRTEAGKSLLFSEGWPLVAYITPDQVIAIETEAAASALAGLREAVERLRDGAVPWDRRLCPACHHKDHDPGSCSFCPNCELHTDEAFDFVLRVEPELVLALLPPSETPPEAP